MGPLLLLCLSSLPHCPSGEGGSWSLLRKIVLWKMSCAAQRGSTEENELPTTCGGRPSPSLSLQSKSIQFPPQRNSFTSPATSWALSIRSVSKKFATWKDAITCATASVTASSEASCCSSASSKHSDRVGGDSAEEGTKERDVKPPGDRVAADEGCRAAVAACSTLMACARGVNGCGRLACCGEASSDEYTSLHESERMAEPGNGSGVKGGGDEEQARPCQARRTPSSWSSRACKPCRRWDISAPTSACAAVRPFCLSSAHCRRSSTLHESAAPSIRRASRTATRSDSTPERLREACRSDCRRSTRPLAASDSAVRSTNEASSCCLSPVSWSLSACSSMSSASAEHRRRCIP
mmetsp:Transcript_10109/g.29047  ORF Transcript_10109/g.29047 Transcript_10109/m.29047 type:complete len:352 (+) Transcript_10109:156-1211(+)